MSRRKKRKPAAAESTVAPKEKSELLEFARKNKRVLIISAIAAVLVIAFVIGLVAVLLNSNDFDYMTSDLSPYLTISPSDYKNIPIEMAKDTVDETDIQRAINKLLFDNKSEEAEKNGYLLSNLPIQVGDVAHIYYRGYTVDENGVETDIDSACNFSDYGTPYELGIGSGSFIYGFEDGLIGMTPSEYTRFKLIRSGYVSAGTVAYISGSVLYPNGTSKEAFTNVRLDLTDPNANDAWGEGFVEYLTGGKKPSSDENYSDKEIGKTLDAATFTYEGGSVVYYDMKVNYVTTCEDAPYTVKTVFPINYSSTDLRGKTVYFDVYVNGYVRYTAPEYNDEFISETLKITEAELAEYEGATLTEKHTAMLKAELEAELEATKQAVIEEAIWDYLYAKAQFKQLPEYKVIEIYSEYCAQIEEMYSYYSSSFSSLDAFARAYYDLSSTDDWREYVSNIAKNIVAEKLIFYYVVRAEGIAVSGEGFDEIYNTLVDEHFEDYKESYADELDEIEDEAEKAERLAELKAEMIDSYGTAYFRENAEYEYAISEIIKLTVVTEK